MITTLIVDDSTTSRMVLRVYLQAIGQTEVFDAADKDAALALATQHSPKVVFMDYNLEGINGIDVAETIRELGIDAKFILLTGDTMESRSEAAMTAGFYAVLQKPVSPEKVQEIFNGL